MLEIIWRVRRGSIIFAKNW